MEVLVAGFGGGVIGLFGRFGICLNNLMIVVGWLVDLFVCGFYLYVLRVFGLVGRFRGLLDHF